MATVSEVMAGLAIIAKHDPDADVGAEYEQIYAGPGLKKKDFSKEEKDHLDTAGWFWSEDADSWSRFV